MADSIPPPIYSQQDPDEANIVLQAESVDTVTTATDPQILILPADAVNFQKGFLGAEGERAAIEGELQIKGFEPGQWIKVTISLRTIETAYQHEIELGMSEIVLFSQSHASIVPLPSSFPFAIPLMPDTAQSILTPYSSLSHELTATLHPLESHLASVSKSITVHTRRYTSHSHTLLINPETHSLEEPTRVVVQVPRTTFKAGEPIPIYVIVPPPPRELVVDQGLRLRNIQAELVRIVKVKRSVNEDPKFETHLFPGNGAHLEEPTSTDYGPSTTTPEASMSSDQPPQPSKAPISPLFLGSSYKTIIARSGASCRFHSSRPVKLRFVLHQPLPSYSPPDFPVSPPGREYGDDAECASITQLTLLHSVTFRLNIHISFVDMSRRTERISAIFFPVTLLAPPAPLPEVSRSIDEAYQKKHDRPPVKTVRQDEGDYTIPHYSEGEAGPSVLPNSAPPPFEERDAPPPFFFSAEASTSTRLPTFLESEAEIIIPEAEAHTLGQPPPPSPTITGEGLEFGFPASEQFDGHSEDLQRSSTPPPTLEMATRDTNLTSLTDIREPERAIEALGLALDRHDESTAGERPPPPPPALDDPSDPPPSIDSDFRSPDNSRQTSPPHSSPPPRSSYLPNDPPPLHTPSSVPSGAPHSSDGHAPPPYLVPETQGDQENVARPPPYMD